MSRIRQNIWDLVYDREDPLWLSLNDSVFHNSETELRVHSYLRIWGISRVLNRSLQLGLKREVR